MAMIVTPGLSILNVAVGGGTVVVEIGLHYRKYYVHKSLLTYHSEYFRKALQGSWKEAQEGIIVLEDVEPRVFNLFVKWLYTGMLPRDMDDWHDTLECDAPNFWNRLLKVQAEVMIEAYAFGDRFLASGFRRKVNEDFVDSLKNKLIETEDLYKLVITASKQIPADRPILQFLVDMHCSEWLRDYDNGFKFELQKDLPQTFLLRVMNRYCELEGEAQSLEGRCYYEHASENEKRACRDLHMRYDELADYGYFS